MGRGTGVIAAGKNSIRISFEYQGQQCREYLKLEPTKANLAWATNRKGEIENKIVEGTFDYYKYFPKSKRVAKFTTNPAQTITVRKVLGLYLDSIAKKIEPDQLADYNEFVNNTWIPRFGDWRLCDLNLAAVEKWIGEQTSSKKRILNLLTPLRQAMRFAVPLYLSSDPLKDVRVQRPEEAEAGDDPDVVDPFDQNEMAAVLEHLEPQVAHMFQAWAWMGLRMSELTGLLWSDIDLEKGTARIRRASVKGRIKATKTKRGKRNVKLLPGALDALQRQKLYTRMLHAEVFMNPKGRQPWTRDKQLRVRWKAACDKAGVRYRSPDNLRHTYASWMLSADESVAWLSAQMGHESVATTLKHYARFIDPDPNAGMRAAAKFGNARIYTPQKAG